MPSLRPFALLTTLAIAAGSVQAQSPHSVALDVTIEVARGTGGPSFASDRTSLALSSVLAMTAYKLSQGSVVIALAGSVNAPVFYATQCLAIPDVACGPFPSLATLALLSGWSQHADFSRGARLLAGPGVVWNSDSNSSGLGLMLRADWANPVSERLAFVLNAQSVVAPTWRGSRIATTSVGLGFRVR